MKKFVTESDAKNARETAEATAASKTADAFAKAEAVKVKNTKKLIRDSEKGCNRQRTAKSAATEEGEDENGKLMVIKLEMGRLGMTMTQARGETNILVTNVEDGGG